MRVAYTIIDGSDYLFPTFASRALADAFLSALMTTPKKTTMQGDVPRRRSDYDVCETTYLDAETDIADWEW